MKQKIIAILFLSFLSAEMFLQAQSTKDFYKNSDNYRIQALNINTDYSDLGAWPVKDGIIFMSNREHPRFSSFINYTDALTNEHFYALYFAKREKDDNTLFSDVSPYQNELQVKYNSGPLTISKDGTTMILTRNVLKKRQADKRKEEDKYYFILQLFQYTYNEKKKKWEKETAFPFNSSNYSCAHAFLSPDGYRLYFSSDMPGGMGGMDIYVCEKNGNSWGTPVNMGKIINSTSNEVFPSLSEDGLTLYFSSDKAGGMGGLDIYSCSSNPKEATTITNLGYPLNSPADDFGLIFYKNEEEGYFSSNRLLAGQHISKGKDSLNDNIYFVKSKIAYYKLLVVDSLTKTPLLAQVKLWENTQTKDTLLFTSGTEPYMASLEPASHYNAEVTLPAFGTVKRTVVADKDERNITISLSLHPRIEGTVKSDNGALIANADVRIKSASGKEILLKTDATGSFSSPPLDERGSYTVTVLADKFHKEESQQIMIPENPKDLQATYKVGLELKAFDRMTIDALVLFDLDKYNIRPDAKKILDSIVTKLKLHPEIDIHLEGHTDSRGSYAYNQVLSEKRANSVKEYLIGKGIDAGRITAEGFGYSRLINRCKPQVECSEAEHQANRRTEFLFSEGKQ